MGDGRDDGRDDDDDDDGNEDDFDDFDDETRPFAARTRSTYVGVLRRASTSMSARGGERAIGIESLDFNDVDSTWSRRRGTSRCPSAKWVVAASIGLCTGARRSRSMSGSEACIARGGRCSRRRQRGRAGETALAAFAGASVGAALAAGAGAATIYGAPNAKGAACTTSWRC